MKDENLMSIWKKTDFDVQLQIDKGGLIEELKAKVSSVDRRIVYRNFLEITVAILFIPVFAYLFYETPYYLFKTGCLVMILWLGYLIYNIISTRRNKPKNTHLLSLKENLKSQKKYLLKERDLINNVFYWYLLPPFIGQLLMLIGLNVHRDVLWKNRFLQDFLSTNISSHVIYIVFLILIYSWIYRLNKKAIRKDIQPVITDIEKIEDHINNP